MDGEMDANDGFHAALKEAPGKTLWSRAMITY
jgi:hypothetical protein